METEKQLISHLYQNKENGKWIIQTNDEHQRGVAEMATSFSGLFGLPSWGHTLGMLHDKGKERDAFQQYIRTTSGLPVTDEKSYGEHHHAFVGGILVTNLMGKSVCGERHREKATSRRDKQRGHSSEYTPVEKRTS